MAVGRRISRRVDVRASMPEVVLVSKEFELMLHIRRSLAAVCAAVFVLMSISLGSCLAAKAKVTVRRAPSSKVYVSPRMIAGSALTKGRAFYRPTVYESTLAGIRLGRPAKEVLVKWGNPTRITLGSVQGQAPTQQPVLGIPYAPSGGAPFLEPNVGGLPGLPGLPAPGTSGAPAAPSSGGESTSLRQEEVTWTYDLQNGITLEFIITEGTVTQITVGGIGPWGLSKTRTGLQLGDTYKLVLWICDYPESQRFVGRFLRLSYVDKSRVLFTLLDKKVVGVTIALVPTEIAGK
jgi:hypothetical protein